MVERKKTSMTKKNLMQKAGYGWVPDLPDHRDRLYGAVRPVPAKLPPAIDLRHTCSPVENQEELGSCTANALAGALEFLERKDKAPYINVSRLFIYYNERVIEHTVRSDSGAMLRDGIKTLKNQGVCSEKGWPYTISKFSLKPAPACYKEAMEHQITSYHRILTLDEMRTCLAEGYPFVFGFTVYEGFESQEVSKTGIAQMPKPDERTVGGHKEQQIDVDVRTCRISVETKSEKISNDINTCDCTEQAKSENKVKLVRTTRNEKIKCETAGIKKILDFIESEKDRHLESLKALQAQFIAEVESYNSWHEDIQKHYDDTIGKIKEMTLGLIVDGIMSSMSDSIEKQIDGRIDEMLKRVKKYKDIRQVKKADLKQYVDALRGQIKGKSREEAKGIVRDALLGVKKRGQRRQPHSGT